MFIFKDYAGWDSFAELKVPMAFLRNYHYRIRFMALVADIARADSTPILASRFVDRVIRHLP
jgi:hypothetical protein